MRLSVKESEAGVGEGLSFTSDPSVLPRQCPKCRQREEEQGFPTSLSLLQNQPCKSTLAHTNKERA